VAGTEGAKRIREAGRFTQPERGATHWVEHTRSDHLSVGTYSVAPGGPDNQVPHTEDEIYFITMGRGRLVTSSGQIWVAPGHTVYVPAGEPHTFVDITEDFAAVVVFAPPETGPA
jgi:mannose-6-phosphate isomerase-like protein (cupin superfamily)